MTDLMRDAFDAHGVFPVLIAAGTAGLIVLGVVTKIASVRHRRRWYQ